MLLMKKMNEEFNGRLSLAIEIFSGEYRRKFFGELIAGQIDMDRLDYLRRDSFYTGVIEGSVGSDRIIRMLNVVDDRLAIDEKGIYSLEKFIIARRLMYWQVYMHKTVLSSESLLVNILKRAKELAGRGEDIYATPALRFFLYNNIGYKDLTGEGIFTPGIVAFNFTRLDDSDILTSAKYWSDCNDLVLADLSRRLIQRDLFAAELQNKPFPGERIAGLKRMVRNELKLTSGEEDYFVYAGEVSNLAYAPDNTEVKILVKTGETSGIQGVSDIFDHRILSERIIKHFLCYPKEFRH